MQDGLGKYEVYAVAGSTYCYKDSIVLRNKLDIRDGELLRKLESDISSVRQTELMVAPIVGRFTASHLCNIHRHLLGDVYSFAGYFRREDIAKGKTRFLGYGEIGVKLKSLLDDLRNEHYLVDLDHEKFIVRSAYFMAELNYIHPFREGNGRAIREFMRLLFLRNDYIVDWSAVKVDTLLGAMIDSVYDTSQLELVLDCCLKAFLHKQRK